MFPCNNLFPEAASDPNGIVRIRKREFDVLLFFDPLTIVAMHRVQGSVLHGLVPWLRRLGTATGPPNTTSNNRCSWL